MKIMLDEGAIMPTRAHETDAGLDLYARKSFVVGRCETCNIVLTGFNASSVVGSAIHDTGVHVEIPKGYVGFLKSKSGLNVNQGIQSAGVIDSGYTGSICVKLYNHGFEAVRIRKGQKISQLVLLPIVTPEIELVDKLEETERGDGGFGSTGVKN